MPVMWIAGSGGSRPDHAIQDGTLERLLTPEAAANKLQNRPSYAAATPFVFASRTLGWMS